MKCISETHLHTKLDINVFIKVIYVAVKTYSNISVITLQSVSMVEQTEVPQKKTHRIVAGNLQIV